MMILRAITIASLFIFHTSISEAKNICLPNDQLRDGISCSQAVTPNPADKICKDVDDIICKDVPVKERRNCQDIQGLSYVTTAWDYFVGCSKGGKNALLGFIKSIPEMVSGALKFLANDVQTQDKVFGHYDSVRAATSAIIEEVMTDKEAYFLKLIEGIRSSIAETFLDFNCLKPELQAQRSCQYMTELMATPGAFGVLLLKGPKVAMSVVLKNKPSVSPIPMKPARAPGDGPVTRQQGDSSNVSRAPGDGPVIRQQGGNVHSVKAPDDGFTSSQQGDAYKTKRTIESKQLCDNVGPSKAPGDHSVSKQHGENVKAASAPDDGSVSKQQVGSDKAPDDGYITKQQGDAVPAKMKVTPLKQQDERVKPLRAPDDTPIRREKQME